MGWESCSVLGFGLLEDHGSYSLVDCGECGWDGPIFCLHRCVCRHGCGGAVEWQWGSIACRSGCVQWQAAAIRHHLDYCRESNPLRPGWEMNSSAMCWEPPCPSWRFECLGKQEDYRETFHNRKLHCPFNTKVYDNNYT